MSALRRSIEQGPRGRVLVVRGERGVIVYDPTIGVDVHSPRPLYGAEEPLYDGTTAASNCPYLDGLPCYADGSSLILDKESERLATDEGAFGLLEALYPSWTKS